MAYVLKKITQKDQEKILHDAEDTPSLQRHLSVAISRNEFPKKWAIDVDRDIYLFLAPRFVKEDSWSLPIYFHIADRLLEIRSEGQLGNHMHFADKTQPARLLNESLDEIKSALSAYGMWGDGPNNLKGEPEFVVNPKFITVSGD